MPIKVFLDDARETPPGWHRAYSATEAISYLLAGDVEVISLDHDLGDELLVGTGYDVIVWIEEQVILHRFVPPVILVHTSNPSARVKMINGIKSIYRRIEP